MKEVPNILDENKVLRQQLEKGGKELRDLHSDYTKVLLEEQELLQTIKTLAKLYSEK